MAKCKRLSPRALIRLMIILVIYVVLLRLHVFRQYHVTERFHRLVPDHARVNFSELAAPDLNNSEPYLASASAGIKSGVGIYPQSEFFYGPLHDDPWQDDTEVLFTEGDSTVLNLDSRRWDAVDLNTINMKEVLATISQSQRALVQCRNDVTLITTRQPIRSLFGGESVVAIGELDRNVSDYAVFGVGLETLDNPRAMSYLFYGPLSTMAWRRIGHGTIVIVADKLDSWLAKPLHRLVLKHLCDVHAVVVFLATPRRNAVMISQTSRIFASVVVRRLLDLSAAPLDYDPYIVTTDVDLWAFKRDMFTSEIDGGELTSSPEIVLLNHGCCAWFVHGNVRQKMYPLTYVRMSSATWWKIIRMNTNMTDSDELSTGSILAVFRQEFGSLADEPVQKGQNAGWFLDQHLLSYWINEYINVNGRQWVMFGSRTGMRLDRIQWPERVSSTTFEYTFDVHLPKLRSGAGWPRVLVLLQFMYGVNTDEYKWCTQYRDRFVSLLPPQMFEVIEE
ncbi:hypothetical protein LSH36_1413g00015 [Paralvinella palmiformis]|uniref:Uncharacterized protein n=1 Tax=Paralvinella palmiformis TaxID=53620 RepID=A0AAD9IT81_9ANNE|nr:hypothetical protein LSH36_1413g00015 [Paralvinella palmiformis]